LLNVSAVGFYGDHPAPELRDPRIQMRAACAAI
jgi:hypothetical protein